MPPPTQPSNPISPSPDTLAYIKEKTRGLHRLKRSSQPATPTLTPPTTSPPTPLHPLHTDAPSSSASSAADAAIARLRLYAHEQHLLRTADDWHQQRMRRSGVRRWEAHLSAHAELHLCASTLRQRRRLQRLQDAVALWADWTQTQLQATVPPARLTGFHSRHLQRKCLTAWVGYTLGRQHKQANATLASYMHRSTHLHCAFRIWLSSTRISQQQSALTRQTKAVHNLHLLRDAWIAWTAELAHSSEERGRERQASAVGDGLRRRHYFRRWRQLRARLEVDEANASTLQPLEERRRVREAWAVWRAEWQWRHRAVSAMKEMERLRREAVMRGMVGGWLRVVEQEKEEEERLQRAMQWRWNVQRKRVVDGWRAAVLQGRVERMRGNRQRQRCIASLHAWQGWSQRRRHMASAEHLHQHHLHSQSLHAWLHALHDVRAERSRLQHAQLHWQRRALSAGLHHWQLLAHQCRQRASDFSLASAHHHRRILLSAVSTLLHNSHDADQRRHHRSSARRHLLHHTVLILHRHALAGRAAWQRFLTAKRHRYTHLLSAAFARWQAAVARIRAAEDALLQERCGGLFHVMVGQLFALWRAQLKQRLTDRQREGEALTLWRRRLLEAGWGEWHRAIDDRRVEKQRAAVADSWLRLHQRWRAVRNWSAIVRTRHRMREAETAALHAAQHRLHQLATRRAFARLLHSFHLARLTRLALSRASSHYHHHATAAAITHWHVVAAGRRRTRQMVGVAVRRYEEGLRKAAWARWVGVFGERRRVLGLHLRALEWRRMREERRVWGGWVRWVEGRRAVKAREEEMRRLRLEKLRVEGCRQWIAVGLEWLARDAEEAKEAEEQRRRQLREDQWRRHRKVEGWVTRIARHWKRLCERRKEGGKAERLPPLLTPDLLLDWRGRAAALEQPQPSPQPTRSPPSSLHSSASEDGRLRPRFSRDNPDPRPALTLAALSSPSTAAYSPPGPPASSFATLSTSSSFISSSSSSFLPGNRLQLPAPRQNAQLLAFDCSFVASIPPPPAHLSASLHSQAPHSAQAVFASSAPWSALGAARSLDPSLLSSTASASQLVDEVAALEGRLRHLAEQRSRYRTAAAELAEVQRRMTGEGERLGDAEEATLREQARLLRESMAAFKRRKTRWKEEVAALSRSIGAALSQHADG